MARQLYRLAMVSPLHIGHIGIGYEVTHNYIPSDTLFAALVITWLQMGTEDAAAARSVEQTFAPGTHPAIRLSSALPYADDVLFLPRPQLPIADSVGGKDFKGVQWVSASLFQLLTAGVTASDLNRMWQETERGLPTDRNAPKHTYRFALMHGGNVWVTQEERTHLAKRLEQKDDISLNAWSRLAAPHVAVGRADNASQLYYVGQTHFAKHCGLWLLAESDEDTWLDRLRRALLHLEDSGIGGQRFRGKGNFVLEGPQDAPALGAPSAQYQVLLSRLAPTTTQISLLQAPLSRYSLVTIGGYSSNPRQIPLVRKRVRMIREGSIVATPEGYIAGQLVDVRPDGLANKPPLVDHPMHRYGFGFGVGVILQDQDDEVATAKDAV